MAKKLTLSVIERFLGDVASDKYFFVYNGPVLKSIEELHTALGNMTEEQFLYHRNNEKNDFYNWVISVIGDIRLANEIGRAKTKETTIKKIKDRLDFLKKIKEGDNNGR